MELKNYELIKSNFDLFSQVPKVPSNQVAKLALFTGLALKLTEEEVSNLVSGALMHDIGKTLVSKKVLKKLTKLTNEEMSLIKQHPMLGHNFVKNLELAEDVKLMILDHH